MAFILIATRQGENVNWNRRRNMEKYNPYLEHPFAERWTGNIKDLVRKIAYSDARYSAIDAYSGAHINLNLDSNCLMYIETPDGEELLDALNQKEAREILARFRRQQKNKLFYECVNCGFLSMTKKFCPACQDTHQKVFGAFESIEDAMAQEIEEKGGNI
jgi:hypothetical protein